MTNSDKDFSNEKDKRREKFKNKKNHIHSLNDEDDVKKHTISKKEVKKIKQSYLDEEWEDWDQYYNR